MASGFESFYPKVGRAWNGNQLVIYMYSKIFLNTDKLHDDTEEMGNENDCSQY